MYLLNIIKFKVSEFFNFSKDIELRLLRLIYIHGPYIQVSHSLCWELNKPSVTCNDEEIFN